MSRPRSIDDATLLTAAREVFVERGPGATTREIARRAGVSEGVLFQRYKTKADLFFAALVPPVADPASTLSVDAEAVGSIKALEDAALRILAYFREAMPLLLPLVNHPSFEPERFFHHDAPASLKAWIDALVVFIDAQRPASPNSKDVADTTPDAANGGSRGAATLLTSAMFGVALIDTTGIHGAPLSDAAIRSMVGALWAGIDADGRNQ